LAEQVGKHVPQWYQGIYRLACDPAHIGDLIEFMPLPKEPLPFPRGLHADLTVSIALDYALHLLWWLLGTASAFLDLQLEAEIAGLEAKHHEVRAA
jgi:hypothetical protein